MNKEDLLLKNYTLLSSDPCNNDDALVSAIQQIFDLNPKLGMSIWENSIRENYDKISVQFGKEKYSYDNPGYVFVYEFANGLCNRNSFFRVLDLFAKNAYLLEIIYSDSPFDDYYRAGEMIYFLIRANRIQEADNILSAIYKNNNFKSHSKLWKTIIF